MRHCYIVFYNSCTKIYHTIWRLFLTQILEDFALLRTTPAIILNACKFIDSICALNTFSLSFYSL